MYQFPIGKVNEACLQSLSAKADFVSIPYRKGKQKTDQEKFLETKDVSIPYRKGKQEHLVVIRYKLDNI